MKDKLHYSIDLETLSTKYNSYILSVGAVEFDMLAGNTLGKFYSNTYSSSGSYHIDINTVKWWMKQSQEARDKIAGDHLECEIKACLQNLNDFIRPGSYVWGNGATFDITILEHAYLIEKEIVPWKFYNIRDMRTLVDLAGDVGFDKASVKRDGAHHNALDDAIYQAKVMSAAYQQITKQRV